MNQDAVKELLLKIENTDLDFSVIFSGKQSKKVNGLYKPDTFEILLHNKNFKADMQLIYTAIHEYTHHLEHERNAGVRYTRVHTSSFWAHFHTLLEKAEAMGLYAISLEVSPELEKLTQEIRTNYLEQNGRLMQEFGRLLARAHQLCIESDIRYEDYIDRVLRLPRSTAKSVMKVGSIEVNPAIGFENMKTVVSLATPEKRAAAEKQFIEGHSPDTVRMALKAKPEDEDPKNRLEKEKRRLEKTIQQLTARLEQVEQSLGNM